MDSALYTYYHTIKYKKIIEFIFKINISLSTIMWARESGILIGIIFIICVVINPSDCSSQECCKCTDEVNVFSSNRGAGPLVKAGEKYYYIGIFVKLNWYKAAQFCRYHGMDLASITTKEENDALLNHIELIGKNKEMFWLSGTDLGQEGSFFWLSTGQPLTYTNWLPKQPDNYKRPDGHTEDCLHLWNTDGKGLKWNDSYCMNSFYFICEI